MSAVRNVTTTLKRKRAIKRSLDAGTPQKQVRKRYKRGVKLIKSVNKTPKEKLFDGNQTNRGSGGVKKYPPNLFIFYVQKH